MVKIHEEGMKKGEEYSDYEHLMNQLEVRKALLASYKQLVDQQITRLERTLESQVALVKRLSWQLENMGPNGDKL